MVIAVMMLVIVVTMLVFVLAFVLSVKSETTNGCSSPSRSPLFFPSLSFPSPSLLPKLRFPLPNRRGVGEAFQQMKTSLVVHDVVTEILFSQKVKRRLRGPAAVFACPSLLLLLLPVKLVEKQRLLPLPVETRHRIGEDF